MFLMLKYALLSATVLMLVALGGCFSEHSGVINLALEGIMVIGGLVGTMALNLLPADMLPVWKVVISICLAAVSGIAYSSLLAFSAINLKADQTIGGTALNLLSTAIALVVVKRYNGTRGAGRGMKYLFYLYYPAHLFLCGLVRILLYGNVGVMVGGQ